MAKCKFRGEENNCLYYPHPEIEDYCIGEERCSVYKVKNIDDARPHKVSEVICVKCGHRWIAVRPEDTKLRELECPNCHRQGYTIETGEEVQDG